MGLLTRTGSYLERLGQQVPTGSTRERTINALAGGVEKTQNLLAGKYANVIPEALRPANTAQYAPLAYGLIGAGGSVAGNAMSGEEKDPGRILTEAAGAGALGALGGAAIGKAGASLQRVRAAQAPVMEAYNQAAFDYAKRASSASQAGARSTALASQQKAADIVQKMAAGEKAAKEFGRDARLTQALYMGGLPGMAGLGGMAGGGISNLAQYMGVPGFQQNTIPDPERATSSNTQMARSYTPTLKYLG
jgi:hypothetical protein